MVPAELQSSVLIHWEGLRRDMSEADRSPAHWSTRHMCLQGCSALRVCNGMLPFAERSGGAEVHALCRGRGLVGPVLHPSLTPDPAAIWSIHAHPPCRSSFQLELLGSLWLSTSNRTGAIGNNWASACVRRTRAVPVMKWYRW